MRAKTAIKNSTTQSEKNPVISPHRLPRSYGRGDRFFSFFFFLIYVCLSDHRTLFEEGLEWFLLPL